MKALILLTILLAALALPAQPARAADGCGPRPAHVLYLPMVQAAHGNDTPNAPSATACTTPTPTATSVASPEPTATATASPTPEATASATATQTATSTSMATSTPTPTPTATPIPFDVCSVQHVVISAFRTRGLGGGNDEFVELFNASASPVALAGWQLWASNSTGSAVGARATITGDIVLGPGQRYLLAHSAYSGTLPADKSYGSGVADSGALALKDAAGAIIDQVGMSADAAFGEGAVLAPLTLNAEQGYWRSPGPGYDRDDNAADFVLLTDGTHAQNSHATPSPLDCALPTATPTPSATPTSVGAGTATASATAVPSGTPSATPTSVGAGTPTATGTATATASATPSETPTSVGAGTATATSTPTASATPTATSETPVASATATATPSDTSTATSTPTATATATPGNTPTATSTPAVSPTPTATPTPGASATRVNHLVISMLYSGGGSSSGALYRKDFVELFNPSASDQSLAGLSLQYGSASGNLGASSLQIYALPTVTIPAGGHFLLSTGLAGSSGGELSVTPDVSITVVGMAATSGKLALISGTLGIGCGATPCALPQAGIIDLVGYGSANTAEGGHALPALSVNTGTQRSTCRDTDDNAADFALTSLLMPRNSASAQVVCP